MHNGCKRALTGLALSLLLLWPAAALVPVSDGFVLEKGARVSLPVPYEVTQVVSSFPGCEPSTLNNAQDLFYDGRGLYYIADTDNNRVLQLDAAFQVKRVISEADGIAFAGPTGVSADAYGDIYVADAGNARVVHLGPDGAFIESFGKPESELLYDVSFFSPAKVELNPVNNYLYVIQGKQFMTIDALGGFKGYVGDNKLGFDLWDFLFRTFASEKQKLQSSKRAPDPYINFCLGTDQRLYAVGLNDGQRISVINTVGANIYPGGDYGETLYARTGEKTTPIFTDIAVNSRGILTVCEQNTGCIYQYDMDGNLLAGFGGKGSTNGYFGVPSSLVFNERDQLVTLDSSLGRLQVFAPTAFMETVHQAIAAYRDGDYDTAYTLWSAVRARDRRYALARKMIGLIEYKREHYGAALGEFYQGEDQANYGKAFERLRYGFFQDHFALVAVGAAVLVVLLLLLVRRGRRLVARCRRSLWAPWATADHWRG